MTSRERTIGLVRTPKLVWDVLARGRYAFQYDQMPMLADRMSAIKRLNLFKSGANLLFRRLRPWGMPLHMQFELANYCNLRCPVCPTGSKSLNRPPVAMDAELFERIMDEVGPYLLTASLWAWGEPLLHPRLKQILRTARKHDVVTLLSTNGQNLNDERVLEALIEEPPAYLILALDGLTDQSNSAYRVGARLAPILEGVKKLAAMKRARGLTRPVLNMRFIVMKHNQHEVGLLDEFAARHGFELLTIRNLFFIESTSDACTNVALTPDSAEWSAHGHFGGSDGFFCLEPFWFPSVFADGTLVLCEQDYNADLSLGRIGGDVSFRDLWDSPRAARLRKTIRDSRESVGFCRKCPYLDRPATDFNVEARYPTSCEGR